MAHCSAAPLRSPTRGARRLLKTARNCSLQAPRAPPARAAPRAQAAEQQLGQQLCRRAAACLLAALAAGPALPDELQAATLLPASAGAHERAGGASAGASPARAPPAPAPPVADVAHRLPDYEQALSSAGRRRAPAQAAAAGTGCATPDDVLGFLNRGLFADDAWEGMRKVAEYALYVDGLTGAEAACGPACAEHRRLLESAWQVVASEYYDPRGAFSQAAWAGELLRTLQAAGGLLRTQSEAHAALASMLSTLGDRYTTFLPPAAFRAATFHLRPAESQYLAAQSSTAGVALGARSPLGGWVVESPLAASPAEEVGLSRGDRILSIDGASAGAMPRRAVEALLRGPVGSTVRLDVAPREAAGPAWRSHRTLLLERRRVLQPPTRELSLTAPGGARVRYIRVHYFSSRSARAVAAAVERAERLGDDGYILDLRNNPGGILEEAVDTAALFLPGDGRIIARTVRGGSTPDGEWRTGGAAAASWAQRPAGAALSVPVVVLANEGTASAAEVLAAALHDHRRALLLGGRTFAKGVVQYFFPLADGSGLRVTVAKWLPPSGLDLAASRRGLRPDVACRGAPRGPGQRDECVAAALRLVGRGRRSS